MEPISLILAALAAGAASAAKDSASQAVKDAYAGLKALLLKRFTGKPKVETVLAEYEQDANTWEKPLQKSLAETGADKDQEVVQLAQQLLRLVNPKQAAQGKYSINIKEAKGVVIGDDAKVKMNFNKD